MEYGVTSSIMTSSSEFLYQLFCQNIWTLVLHPLAKFDKGMSRLF